MRDFKINGFDDIVRLNAWLQRLRTVAWAQNQPQVDLDDQIARHLRKVFDRALKPRNLDRMQKGVHRFGVERIKPELRAELDRRIMASANLIKLNREQAIEKTLQRFSGWATSIPAGGSKTVDLREAKADIGKPVRGIPFEVRRVQIDQGHKLVSAVNDVIAIQTGAIAAIWRSHGRHDKGYDARPEHLARDGKVYAIRGNWAMQRGLMKKGLGYTDEITRPAEEPFCRCWYEYLHNLRELPEDMLTAKGRFALQETKVAA
ncbi:MAG: hypothetical protein KGL35_29210 [Bradyrhizobium sp.]|nr:hypothetical protein [Bradyrhizobium sp.]